MEYVKLFVVFYRERKTERDTYVLLVAVDCREQEKMFGGSQEKVGGVEWNLPVGGSHTQDSQVCTYDCASFKFSTCLFSYSSSLDIHESQESCHLESVMSSLERRDPRRPLLDKRSLLRQEQDHHH